jgi:hypothetical protein
MAGMQRIRRLKQRKQLGSIGFKDSGYRYEVGLQEFPMIIAAEPSGFV